jgi:hypothetical protein
MATEPPARPALPSLKLTSAAAAGVREVIDDLIHLILRPQLTAGTPVPRLPTGLALLALTAHQLLGLRPRLRSPLRARLGRIHRWRRRARARILARLLLQPLQPIPMLLNLGRQLEHELDTRLAP